MSPFIAIIMTIGGVLLGGAAGFILAQSRVRTPAPESADLAPRPVLDPRLERAQADVQHLEALLGTGRDLSIAQAQLAGDAVDGLEHLLSDIFGQKQVRAAAFFDDHAMAFADKGDEVITGHLGGLVGASIATGALEGLGARVELVDDRGQHIAFERVPGIHRRSDLILATWTSGLPAHSLTRARTAHALGHRPLTQRPIPHHRPIEMPEGVDETFTAFAEAIPCASLTLFERRGDDRVVLLDAGERSVFPSVDLWAYARERHDSGHVDAIVVHARAGTWSVHHLSSEGDAEILAALTWPSGALLPEAKLESWLGKIRWRIPTLGRANKRTPEFAVNSPTPDMHPQGGAR